MMWVGWLVIVLVLGGVGFGAVASFIKRKPEETEEEEKEEDA